MKLITRITGVFYFVILFYIFFLARRRPHPTLFMNREPVNFIPLKYKLNNISIYHTLNHQDKWVFLTDLFGNIILFIPLPFFLVFLFHEKKTGKMILVAFIMSFCVELTQFVFSVGVADIDDIILNVLGAVTGLAILKFLKNVLPQVYGAFDK